MNETLEASEVIAEIYQPNNTIEYIVVMAVFAFVSFLVFKYFMSKKPVSKAQDSNLNLRFDDLKEDIAEIKDLLRDVSKEQIDNGKKLARDYQRLNDIDKKNETLFEHMNSSNIEIAEIKGRLS